MITISCRDHHPLAKGPAEQTISERCARLTVTRVDVRCHPDGPALLLVQWEDGSRGICDWRDARACIDWLRLQDWARGVTTVHYHRGVSRPLVPMVAA